MSKVIALIDCNNFYVSCERLFNPSYIGKPVVVLSNNDGCVVSRSNESKLLGIPMGAPYFKFEEICRRHKIITHSSNYELYGDISQRVMATLEAFVPDMEVYSIDEAFVDLTGILDPLTFCIMLRRKVMLWTGIPVSIGISYTKTLAKAAGEVAKKSESGVGVLFNVEDIDITLKALSIYDVWGIGKQWGTRLELKFNIRTAYDLKQASPKFIREHFSVVMERIIYELNGIACLELEEIEAKKSISSTRTFGRSVSEIRELREAVASYTANAARKLRMQNSKVYSLYVYIRTDYYKNTTQYNNGKVVELVYPTSDTGLLINAAIKGLEAVYKSGFQYKKAGVILLNIVQDSYLQQDILEEYSHTHKKRSKALMQAVDLLNKKYGRGTIQHAAEGIKKEWKVKAELLSPRYSTRWDELKGVG
ncbi:Y-family DNA polymerase [Candidatus Jidaibacter acanthamoebae]|nr:Y-family DNA polymerase [Candidatus Jidaibacter acanthamoeba]